MMRVRNWNPRGHPPRKGPSADKEATMFSESFKVAALGAVLYLIAAPFVRKFGIAV